MAPKVLMMPVYSDGNEIERLRGELSLTCFFRAHLDVLHAQVKPSDILEPELFALSPSVRDQLISIMDANTQQKHTDLHEHFRDLCAEYDVAITKRPQGDQPTAAWRDVEGARSEAVALQGRVSDLIIIPHSTSGDATLTFQEAIFHTGRPVLLVPREMDRFEHHNVLIGWNGGVEISRAVQQALPFLKTADAVAVATSAELKDQAPTVQNVIDYLSLHDVAAETKILETGTQSPGEGMLSIAEDLECDLLVTGAYSHTRLRQRILGGVTSHLLRHANIPVLLAH